MHQYICIYKKWILTLGKHIRHAAGWDLKTYSTCKKWILHQYMSVVLRHGGCSPWNQECNFTATLILNFAERHHPEHGSHLSVTLTCSVFSPQLQKVVRNLTITNWKLYMKQPMILDRHSKKNRKILYIFTKIENIQSSI